MISADTLSSELRQFTGTLHYYRNPLYSWLLYTDGVKYLADNAQCYWLLDIIGTELKRLAQEEAYLHLILRVSDEGSAVFTADDGNYGEPLYTKRISSTDFPRGEWHLYLCNEVLLVPSEY
jgi:hypothetical protein